mmetsp:Transcript_1917/g.4421  ORF Transcript_1917/g.4421 Transcript_1917/m.4421 type:complete len:206 (+) Transcript_1917:453-1070(+)
MRRVRRQRRVHDRSFLDHRVSREPFCKLIRILRVGLGAQCQCFDTLDQLERVERTHAPSHISQSLDTGAKDEYQVGCSDTKDGMFGKICPMVSFLWSTQQWEFQGPVSLLDGPIERRTVDDDTTNGGTMSTNPFRCRLNNDIGTEFEGPACISTHPERVVTNDRNLCFRCNLFDPIKVGNCTRRIRQGFNVDTFRILINGIFDFI